MAVIMALISLSVKLIDMRTKASSISMFSEKISYRQWLFIVFVLGALLLSGCGSSEDTGTDLVTVDYAIAYVKRTLISVDEDDQASAITSDLREPYAFRPGAQLYVRERASPSAAERNITDRLFIQEDGSVPPYDIKDLSVSYNGEKLIFALRAPEIEDADEEDQPTWNIWTYDITTDEFTRIIPLDITAEEGQDTHPLFLPDGRILFSSTRQRTAKARLLDESKSQFSGLNEGRELAASVLHVMDEDGSNITQISFNPNHDLDPVLLNDGRILFSRWDHFNGTDPSAISLYTLYPDGSHLAPYYGIHSHTYGEDITIQFTQPQPLDNGQILTLIRDFTDNNWRNQLLVIDGQNYTDANQPTAINAGLTDSGQSLFTGLDLKLDDSLAIQGRLAGARILNDGSQRLLASWSPCRLVATELLFTATSEDYLPCNNGNLELVATGTLTEALPIFGGWILDIDNNTQLPLVFGNSQSSITDIISLEPRTTPPLLSHLQSENFDADLATGNLGALHIRSVYDVNGEDTVGISSMADPLQTAAADRPARFLRLIKSVAIPDDDIIDVPNSAFGVNDNHLMKEIIGYVPIEPDGSVKVAIPANVAFTFSILNEDGERTESAHQSWLQVQPGETIECLGCHLDGDDSAPHGRLDAQPDSANSGALLTGSFFPNTQLLLSTEIGETMAETYARNIGIRLPTHNLRFEDEWTDPSLRTPDAAFDYNDANLTTEAPTTSDCQSAWSYLCRSVIHYLTHIQPIWLASRPLLDENGISLGDSCVSCHNTRDAMNVVKIPDGQLDLTDGISADEPDHVISYRELLFNDDEQEVVDGVLLDRLVIQTDGNGNTLFAQDEEGNLILDAENNPIPLTETITVRASMSANGAQASRFLTTFNSEGNTIDHRTFLTNDELKLIREWLDIGAQYYNDPFAVPIN